MNRRIRIILLTVSLLLVVGTLGWLTHVLLIQAEETGRSERRIKVESLAHEAKLEMDRLLTAFITFEQARGYYEYLPFYAYKRPYDQRMDAPAPANPPVPPIWPPTCRITSRPISRYPLPGRSLAPR